AYGSPKPSERGITLMLFAWLFAGMVKPEIPAIVWSWWSQVLPETGTTLHLVTTGLLTLLSWLAMMLGVIGVGRAFPTAGCTGAGILVKSCAAHAASTCSPEGDFARYLDNEVKQEHISIKNDKAVLRTLKRAIAWQAFPTRIFAY
ncbi:hypothetical protein CCACVL1_01294, partial [Corchorus capsularis]